MKSVSTIAELIDALDVIFYEHRDSLPIDGSLTFNILVSLNAILCKDEEWPCLIKRIVIRKQWSSQHTDVSYSLRIIGDSQDNETDEVRPNGGSLYYGQYRVNNTGGWLIDPNENRSVFLEAADQKICGWVSWDF